MEKLKRSRYIQPVNEADISVTMDRKGDLEVEKSMCVKRVRVLMEFRDKTDDSSPSVPCFWVL